MDGDRRDQVLRLQAELQAKRLELVQLQQRVHKAEVCRRSQQSGVDHCGTASRTSKPIIGGNENPPEQSACSSQANQGLVRSLSDPHSPVWLSGQHYPAQYLIRQTRSMSKAQGHQASSLIKLKPPPNMMMPVREFDLPDDMFFHLKQERMLQSGHNHSSCIQCELVEGSESMVDLRCTEVIPCQGGKLCARETSEVDLVVGQNGSWIVSFSDSLVVRQRSSGNLSNYSLSEPVTCLASISTSNGIISVIATAHPVQLLALVLAGNQWEHISLTTNHLQWPTDYECQYLSVSESTCASVIIAACCIGVVGVWKLSSSDHWTSEVIGSLNIPLLCSLTLAQDSLVATTSNHNLLVSGSCAMMTSASTLRQVPLCCCSDLPPTCQDVQPKVLSARKISNVLVIILTFKSATGAWFNVAGWVLAVKDSENVPYLLHTYCNPRTSIKKPLALKAYTCLDKGLALVGVSDGHHLNVWRGTDELPSVTVNVRASEDTHVIGVDWDPMTDTCLVIDKFKQIHCFQNSNTI